MHSPRHRPFLPAFLFLAAGISLRATIILNWNASKGPFRTINPQGYILELTPDGYLQLGFQDLYNGHIDLWSSGRRVQVRDHEEVQLVLQTDNNLCIYRKGAHGARTLVWNSGRLEKKDIPCVLELVGGSLRVRHATPNGRILWQKGLR